MDTNQVNALVARYGWKVALGAFLIFSIVRLLKADTTIVPIVVPARWRPMVVWALSLLGLALEHFINGTPATLAALMALMAGGGALAGHATVVDSIRGGKDVPVPKPPSDGAAFVLLGALALVGLNGCSWFKPAAGSDKPPPAQAAVLYAAKAVDLANRACVAASDGLVTRSLHEDDATALETLAKAKALNEECRKAIVVGRTALESVEKLLETGALVSDAKIGCALKRGLDAAQDVCTFMRIAKVGKCPSIVDSAITFGSPLIAVAGACPLKETP